MLFPKNLFEHGEPCLGLGFDGNYIIMGGVQTPAIMTSYQAPFSNCLSNVINSSLFERAIMSESAGAVG